MATKSSKSPHRSKPYALKVAEKAAAKRAMRGNKEHAHDWVRPNEPRPAQNSRIDQPSEQVPD
ncbi:MAG: hypothetical protein ACTHN5_00215 [Phycisphaerae bacterium]